MAQKRRTPENNSGAAAALSPLQPAASKKDLPMESRSPIPPGSGNIDANALDT